MYSLLYVDDEPGLLEIGRLYLQQTGKFTVTCALSAKEALDLLSRNNFDAIVSDYQMPGMDGIELLKEVRTSHGQIPFILFTGRGREEVVIAAINNGADFYLQKGGEPRAQFAELAHKLLQAIGRTHAEKALSDSEKRLADIINFLPDATFAIDTKGTVIAWNRAIEEMTGTAAADLLGKGNYEYAVAFYGNRRPMLIDLVSAPDGQFEQDHYLYTRHTPTTLTAETEFEREGQPPAIHLWGKASRLFNEKGEITGAIESIRDITDMKKSEMELRAANEQLAASGEELRSQYNELAASEKKIQENEEKYRTLVEHSQDGIFITQDGHLMFHNRGFREILGYAEGELDGISIDRCLAPEDREMVLARHYARLSGNRLPEVYECSFLNRDGTKRRVNMDVGLASYRGKPATIGTIHDVTGERSREEALLRSEENYRSLVENLQDVVYRTDREGRLTMVSPSGPALLGYDSPDDLLGKPIADSFYLVPEKRQEFLDELYRNGSVKNVEIEIRHKDGTPVFVSTSSHLYYNRDGAVLGIEGILHDITERKQMENAIRESEARYRLLVENSHDIIYTINPDGIFTFVSPVWTTLLGHPVSEVTGKSFQTFVHPLDVFPSEAFLAEVVKTGKPTAGCVYRVFHADGSIRLHTSNISPVFDERGTLIFYIGTAQDITDVRKSENAIREANRKLNLLNSITRHDVANQLAIMRGFTQMAALKKPDPAIADLLRKIDTAGTVIQRQIEFMRTYQDLGVKAPAWSRIDDLVSAARPPEVTVTSTCGTAEIFSDPMIGRVFFNLFDNAVRHGETVTQITVRCEPVSEDLVITVEDNGIGVPPDEKQKIFDKGFGKNTGFGLFLVREILAITGISIHETGISGKGARFEITVPKGAYRSAAD